MTTGTPTTPRPTPSSRPGLRTGPRSRPLVLALGPAFVASIAYVDPGNFATNVSGGALFGYTLLWVVLTANVVAVLVQYLAAKMGVATGKDLAELCRDLLPTPARWGMWAQAELVAMATDLAEFVGAAIALQLLFDIPPLPSGAITAGVVYLVLYLRGRGRRPFEVVTIALLAVILLCVGYELVLADPEPATLASGLVPGFAGSESVLLASGIVGATVMPHAVYLHSALTAPLGRQAGGSAARRALLPGLRLDVVGALTIAGFVNAGLLVIAAATFHEAGPGPSTLEQAHQGFGTALGSGAALAFGVALLASGLSSASVGTCAGDVVMRGFLRRRIPPALRRAVTMLPALLLLAAGTDTTAALVLSQVVLSFGIPFTLVPLVVLTSRRTVMGALVNRRVTTLLGTLVSAAIIALNCLLVVQLALG